MESGSTGGGSFCRGKMIFICCEKKQNLQFYIVCGHSDICAHWCFLSPVKQADPVVVLNDNNAVVITSNRLQEGSVPPLEQGMVVGQLVLADSLIIGNCNNQVLTH